MQRDLLYYATPAICFIVLYSFLPHKEFRFIMPVLPMLYLVAAVGLSNVLPPTEVLVAPIRVLFSDKISGLAIKGVR
jgi:alpha-1,6-mannosyltransferase